MQISYTYFNQINLYLIHSSGRVSQSIMHLYRSHVNHPIGGVSAKPLSREYDFCDMHINISKLNENFILCITIICNILKVI